MFLSSDARDSGGEPTRPLHEMSDISLRQAYLFALGYSEIQENVPRVERMGLLPGRQEDPEQLNRTVTATGPRLVAAIPKPARMPTRRSQPPSVVPPFKPRVPSVPTHEELSAMESDQASAPSSQTRAEQRALAVAEWLKEALATSALPAEGRCRFIPEDGSDEFFLDGYGRVDADLFRQCPINFADSWIHDPENAYSIPGYPDSFLGKIWYEDAIVQYDRLFDLLKETQPAKPPPEFTFDPLPAHNATHCVITFAEERIELQLNGHDRRHRALMALALLIKWPDQGISPQLIYFLTFRNVNTWKKSGEASEKYARLAKGLTEIAENLYEVRIGIVPAHDAVAETLSRYEEEGAYEWLPNVTPRAGVKRIKPSKPYANRKTHAKKLIASALLEIRENGGPMASNFLEERLDLKQHAFTFRTNKPAARTS